MKGWLRCWWVVLWLATVVCLPPGPVLGRRGDGTGSSFAVCRERIEGFGISSGWCADMLASRLSAGGGVTVIEKARVDAVTKGRPVSDQEAEIRALGTALGVDYIIAGSLTSLAGGVSLDARAFPVAPGRKPKVFLPRPTGK